MLITRGSAKIHGHYTQVELTRGDIFLNSRGVILLLASFIRSYTTQYDILRIPTCLP